jgi:hypothetical protein
VNVAIAKKAWIQGKVGVGYTRGPVSTRGSWGKPDRVHKICCVTASIYILGLLLHIRLLWPLSWRKGHRGPPEVHTEGGNMGFWAGM